MEKRQKGSQHKKSKPKRSKGKKAAVTHRKNPSVPPLTSTRPTRKKVSPQQLKARYLQSLYQRKSNNEHPRVTKRWQTQDPDIIRQYKGYEGLSADEILYQRARHYLPGIEKIFAEPKDRKIYTFPTDSGVGMFCAFNYQDDTEFGAIYFGIGKTDKVIFHKYFKPIEPSELAKSAIFHDSVAVSVEEDGIVDEGEWKHTLKYQFDLAENGVVKVKYPGESHYIEVYPLRKDLLS